MPSEDCHADSALRARSLSEQLRVLELRHGGVEDIALPRPGQRNRLPTFLGRPIGLTQLDGFPRVAELTAGPEARTLDEETAPPRRSALRRGFAIAAAVVLLLGATAVLPPLIWGHIDLPTPSAVEPSPAPLRTEKFASVARELALAPATPATPPAVTAPTAPVLAQPTGEPAARSDAPPAIATPAAVSAPEPLRTTTTIEVAEHELASVVLPKIVTGVGPAARGSAIVIDGLPIDARLSHGIRIAPDSWAIGIRDVAGAVLTLPRTTPGPIDLIVRVVAADSHELAANTLRILVVRSNSPSPLVRTATRPATHFEPAAATGQPGLDAIVSLPRRKPQVPEVEAKLPEWPTRSSAWTETAPRNTALPQFERAPQWAPFGNGSAP